MKTPSRKIPMCSAAFAFCALASSLVGYAQTASPEEARPNGSAAVSNDLPDAPSTLLARADVNGVSSSGFSWETPQASAPAPQPSGPGVAPQVARKYTLTIKAGQTAEPWNARDKIAAAFLKQATLGTLFSTSVSAGWNHLRDGRPHYGSDSPAFGQRWGASLARQSSQTIFSVGVLSPLLRDDPRYYVMGPTHPFKRRVIYAATRVFVTRTDSGHSAPNLPLLVGMASSQALTNAYYPDGDRSASRVLTSTLTSIATRMGTQQFKEFSADIRQHLPFFKKR